MYRNASHNALYTAARRHQGQLFADDVAALKIIEGLCDGLSAEQIRLSTGLSKTEYDSARRRMRRTVLREGLTCEPK
jgi:RNA polymerase sigma-70 factor (ECF subfamily)